MTIIPILRRQALALPRRSILTPATRTFTTTRLSFARKDAQDKDSMKVEPNEYSKSGSDNAASEDVENTAFSRDKTRPEEQHASAESESSQGNPLDVSPANQEVSKPRPAQEGGHEGSSSQSGQGPSDRARTSGGSGGSSSKKGGSGQKYSS